MKALRISLALLLSLVCWQLLSQYFFCTRYLFNKPEPFNGRLIYNPYDSISAGRWLKCNFHAHAVAWNGITNGHGTAADIHHAYDSLGYAVHSVSNYHEIDTQRNGAGIYVPAYEHGYNICKTHQQVLGAGNILWIDYLLPQVLSNKQDIIGHLSADPNSVVVLNHPALRNGYSPEDLSQLNNYHCMEVLNPVGTSFPAWDAALSAGKPVFVMGNDDIHNITGKLRLGRMCTFVNTPVNDRDHVLQALRTGRSYGVSIGASQDPKRIPLLTAFGIDQDTVRLQLDTPADRIEITGQQGRLLAVFRKTDVAAYVLKPTDHYARVSAYYKNGTSVYLNPVFFTKTTALSQLPVYPDHLKTLLFRCAGVLLAAAWIRWALVWVGVGTDLAEKWPGLPRFPKPLRPGNPPFGKRRRKRIAW